VSDNSGNAVFPNGQRVAQTPADVADADQDDPTRSRVVLTTPPSTEGYEKLQLLAC